MHTASWVRKRRKHTGRKKRIKGETMSSATRLDRNVNRRDFLKTAVAAAIGSVAAGVASGAVPKGKRIDLADTIPTRVLGKTGVKLPIVGYGGAGLVKIWGSPLSLEDRVKLVRYAYDRGVRYFDTAGNYMESQSILGEGLKDVRDNVYLVSKVETTVPGRVRMAVEKSLKELKTDYLDAILIHGTPGIEQMTVEQAMKVHGELVKLRNERIVRFIGFSAHSYFDKALALISSGGFDQCMLSYGYIPRGHNQIWSARMVELRNACVAKAHQLGMGIAAMKVVGGGVLGAWSGYVVPGFDKKRLGQLPAAAIRYVLQDERIHLLTIGMRLKEEVDANIRTLSRDATYSLDDRALLAQFTANAFDSEAIKRMRID
jgi:predicted aldo/keto reductase-like oxidoreductase